MKVYKVIPGEGLNPCVELSPENVLMIIQKAEPGDQIIIDVLEMTYQEYEKLSECLGP